MCVYAYLCVCFCVLLNVVLKAVAQAWNTLTHACKDANRIIGGDTSREHTQTRICMRRRYPHDRRSPWRKRTHSCVRASRRCVCGGGGWAGSRRIYTHTYTHVHTCKHTHTRTRTHTHTHTHTHTDTHRAAPPPPLAPKRSGRYRDRQTVIDRQS